MASQFQPLLDSITDAVNDRNRIAALALALMLPDICGKIQRPAESTGQRYAKWWADNFTNTYRYGTGPSDYVTGAEVYQLRCAYLHEGSERQSSKKKLSAVIDKFNFTISKQLHLTKQGTIVSLHVQTFCEDMRYHVEEWEKNVLNKHPHMQTTAGKLLKLYLLFSMGAKVGVTAKLTSRYMRKCQQCGNTFPQTDHPSLCSDCR